MRLLEIPENADFEKVSAHVRLLETIRYCCHGEKEFDDPNLALIFSPVHIMSTPVLVVL